MESGGLGAYAKAQSVFLNSYFVSYKILYKSTLIINQQRGKTMEDEKIIEFTLTSKELKEVFNNGSNDEVSLCYCEDCKRIGGILKEDFWDNDNKCPFCRKGELYIIDREWPHNGLLVDFQ